MPVARFRTASLGAPAAAVSAFTVLGLALRFYRVDAQSMWYDEGVSAFMTTRTVDAIVNAAAADIHPPLYYILLAQWSSWAGRGELALRSFSVLVGAAVIPLVWLLGVRLVSPATGIIASGLVAISPLSVQYSQEVRMYGLASLLGAVSTFAYTRLAATRRPTLLAVVAYAASATALIYTHYFGVLVLACHQAHALATLRRERDFAWYTRWLGSTALVALAFLPWLPIAIRQTGYYPGLGQARPGWAIGLDAANVMSLGIATTRFAARLALLPYLGLVVLGAWSIFRRSSLGSASVRGPDVRSMPSVLLILWLVLPLCVIIALSVNRPLYEPRFLMLVIPAWLILVGAGLESVVEWTRGFAERFRLPRPLLQGTATVCVVAGVLVPTVRSLDSYFFDPAYARDDYRGLAQHIVAREDPGDAVVLTAPGQAEIFGYYYRGASDVYPLPRQRPIDVEKTNDDLRAVATTHSRVWLVRWAHREADPVDVVGRWLDQQGTLAELGLFGAVELRLYQLSAVA